MNGVKWDNWPEWGKIIPMTPEATLAQERDMCFMAELVNNICL